MFSQGTILIPKQDFSVKVNGKGRSIRFSSKNTYWVSNTFINQTQTGFIHIVLKNKPMGYGYDFTIDQVKELFQPG